MTVLDRQTAFAATAPVRPHPIAPRTHPRPFALGAVELSVIVPTFNESANLDELVGRIARALHGVAWEVIVVDDDSPDRTADHARAMHRIDPRVRVIRRIGRRGLASACVEGMLASSAPYLAVIDADLQHDPALLAEMVGILRGGDTDLVAASRHVPGGSIGDWSEGRATTSRFATWMARKLTAIELTDPMSGYFAIRREVIDRFAPRLSAIGFKLLLDIVLTAGAGLRVREVPLRFALRHGGESKLSPRVIWDYGMMLADKTIGQVVPVRLIAFAAVGGVGVIVHMIALTILMKGLGLVFALAQAGAALIAMTGNYAINNVLTYADRRRRGWRWLGGLGSFVAVCSVGAVANIVVATLVAGAGVAWPIAALTGIAVAMLWNYGASARHTWSPA